MSFPNSLDADRHQQITAICHFLFTQAGPAELAILMGLLKQHPSTVHSSQWSINIQLATCVRDEDLIANVVDQIVKTRNAAIYLSVLQVETLIEILTLELSEQLLSPVQSKIPRNLLAWNWQAFDARTAIVICCEYGKAG
jgi:hypothetical protein